MIQLKNLPVIDKLKRIFKCETNKELAEKLGITPQHLCRINNGRGPVPRWMYVLVERLS